MNAGRIAKIRLNEMLDAKKVKDFWDRRPDNYNKLSFESLANLENDPKFLDIKIRTEMEKVFAWLPDLTGKTVLDLGAGVGQWAFRFQHKGAKKITAVEFSAAMIEVGKLEARKRNIDNVDFILSSAENYCSPEHYDVIFISGLMIYLNDEQAEKLLSNLRAYSKPESTILLRDGTGVGERFEINNRYSANLQAEYSATYRTAEQYEAIFARYGFSLTRSENMFPEGHMLNKYPETRLRLYHFEQENG